MRRSVFIPERLEAPETTVGILLTGNYERGFQTLYNIDTLLQVDVMEFKMSKSTKGSPANLNV